MAQFGDFEEIKEDQAPAKQPSEEIIPTRVRLPQRGQLIGIVIQRLGGNRMSVKATDNKIRNCRVPGRFSRKFWIRPRDAVIIQPWEFDDDKADIVHHFRKPEMTQLRKRGFLDKIKEEF
ncbi:MAG: translation initiation factor eIF-1A [Nanoarchaeota archaeon]|nr:translation initiation factor eIF-1A [Nanoarchaeota archaeon]